MTVSSSVSDKNKMKKKEKKKNCCQDMYYDTVDFLLHSS